MFGRCATPAPTPPVLQKVYRFQVSSLSHILQHTMDVDELDPSSPEAMLAFYRRLYPFKSIFKWLNHEHSPTRLFTNREIAYTLQSDVYLRYNSFTTVEEFKKQTCSLNPTRFEIGPVYTARVRTAARVDWISCSDLCAPNIHLSPEIRRPYDRARFFRSNASLCLILT